MHVHVASQVSLAYCPYMAVSTLQLRVLNGPQAGAKAKIEPGVYTLGASPRADFVLRGDLLQEDHAEVQLGDGTILLKVHDSKNETRTLKLGEVFMLGGVLLAIDEPGAPWPEITIQEDAVPDLPAELAAPAEEIDRYRQVRANVGLGGKVKDTRRFGAYAVPLAIGAVIASIPLSLLFVATLGLEASVPSRSAMGVDPLIEMRRALANQHKDGQLQLVRTTTGLVVQGHVLSSDERLAVTRWARQLGTPVRVNVFAIPEMRLAAEEASAHWGEAVQLAIKDDGRAHVSGVVPSAEARERLLAAVREDVPGLRDVADEVITVEGLQTELAALVADAPGERKGVIDLQWQPPLAFLTAGTVDAGQFAAYQSWRKQVSVRHPTLKWQDQVRAVRSASTATAATRRIASLPIVAVVGGTMPYVILEDGRKVQEGGDLIDGHVLLAFAARHLTIRERSGALAQFDLP
jgi:type III secretion system YscD/HrpQ family protein